MAFTIQTNLLANSAQRTLNKVDQNLGKTIERLATGTRIVSAADDPAGLAISDTMGATVRSLGQATRNAQDGLSLVQVFEGGTNEINNMLIRIRELAMQSASDTVGERERGLLNEEVTGLKSEITRVARTTVYLDRELLAGDNVRLEFQIGIGNDPEKDRVVFEPGKTDLTAEGLGVDGISVQSRENSQESLATIDEALLHVNELRARIGSSANRLQTTINSQEVYRENLMGARARIRDADMAAETTNLTRESILRQAGVAVLTHANESPRLALQLLRI